VNESASPSPSVFGTLARKGIAWLILIAIAVILLKVAVGIVVGLLSTVVIIAAVAALAYGAFWAYRRL
jgi:hypothetical protein